MQPQGPPPTAEEVVAAADAHAQQRVPGLLARFRAARGSSAAGLGAQQQPPQQVF
jgi:acyl-homoserine lactone acylase PvdQ